MLTGIQQKLLQLMKELDKICRDNGIHYTLGGGTAIGAIRHRGFIPWDDDIDLYMTRDNWEKFKAAGAAGALPPNRVIESAETDIGYTNTIGRYVTTDTSSVHSHQIIYDDPAGHVIDVFVFDPLNISNYRRFLEDMMLYSDLMDETKGYSSRFDMNLERYPAAFARCEKGDKRAVIDELTGSFTHMDDPGWEHYIMEWGVAPFLFPASIFDGGYIRVPFEDTTVEIVRNYYEYLVWQYGDEWMYIPPHDGREGHDAIFSNEIPYTTVRDDYRPFIDAPKVRKAYIRRKKRLLAANPHRRAAEKRELEKKGRACAEALVRAMAGAGLTDSDLTAMAADGRFSELSEIFDGYYKVQLSPEFAGRKDKHSTLRRFHLPEVIDITPETAAAAAETLMRTEQMSKAKRLIDMYTGDFPENLSDRRVQAPGLNALRREILDVRDVMYRYSLVDENGDAAELLAEIKELAGKYDRNSYLIRTELRLLTSHRAGLERAGVPADDIEDLAAEADKKLRELCPEGSPAYWEALKLSADLRGADVDTYARIYRGTRNGCVRLELGDMLGPDACCYEDEDGRQAEAADACGSAAAGKATAAGKKHRSPLYSVARSVYRTIAGRDDRLKERAWEIACRTRDRVRLLETYECRIEDLVRFEKEGRWKDLAAEMEQHEEAVLRNYGKGLGLCVHPELSRLQYELFRRDGRADLAGRIDRMVPDQHRVPIGR